MKLHDAKRPVLIFGAGIHQAKDEAEARELAEILQIPVCLTWGASDRFPENNPLVIGGFGTHGTRAANFAVQNADYLLCVGTRLDTKATGTPAKWFAREAHIVMVDIDGLEIDKMKYVGVEVEGIRTEAKGWLRERISWEKERKSLDNEHGLEDLTPPSPWLRRCQDWKRRYPAVMPEYEQEDGINPYVLVRVLSRLCQPGEIIVSDTGCALAWMMQAFEFKEGQRFLHPMNQTPMGYGLPAAIGAHYATGKRVICVTGDGSIMMSIGELATIAGHNLPIKIMLLNNAGHAMCRQTQREWMGGTYPATSIDGGLTFPDFYETAKAFGFTYAANLTNLLAFDGPVFHEAIISHDADVVPKARFGAANEDAYPPLPREVMEAEMIVPMVGA